jgi:hypothetical protein
MARRKKAPKTPEFDTPNAPDEVVANIAAEMSAPAAKPTPEEREQWRLQREAWHRDQQRQAEWWRLIYKQKQVEAEEVSRRERAAVAAEAGRKARLERQAEIDRQVRQREMADLRLRVTRADWFRQSVENAARNAAAYQARQTLMNELEAAINPPPPPSEPEVIYVEPEEEMGALSFVKPVRWR